ncbi:MAG: glycoside hydrolase family 92 protein [Armatimonadetes bacterium]|nr:glycoside hydrolase family 92 protein [Armatimonadota bacterium]
MAAILGTLFAACSLLSGAPAHSPIEYVNPMVGSDGHGHTFPGPTVPFGMVQLSPDTRTGTWDGSSGYHYSDKKILGFSHTHLSGTGVGCLGDIMLMPTVGDGPTESRFEHKNEIAKPGYYKVFLDDPKVTVELTATARAGLHKYTFPKSDQAHVFIDLIHGISNDPRRMTIKVEGKNRISGSRTSSGWGGERTVYFVAEFSKPFDSVTIEKDGNKESDLTEASGRIRAWANFSTGNQESVLVKVGISSTSVEGAAKNLHTEIPAWDFAGVRKSAEKQWNDALGAITVQSKDPSVTRTFYSNAYLCYIAPSLFNDVDGSYYGMDHKVHQNAKFNNYTTFSLWDTYRALHPLLTITQPKRVPDLTRSLISEYGENGLKTTPIWPLCGNETWCMIGYHTAPVIVDAYFKGLLGPDAETAYQALKATAMGDHNGLTSYRELGYVASQGGAQAASKTVEYSVDDWCIATMAKALGHTEDAKMFFKRSSNYRNLFDRTSMFIRGRKANGDWRAPFDTLGQVGDEYTEACAWQYAFAAQHDIPGIIDLYGGDAKFSARMDEMFANDAKIHTGIPDITGMIGQYAQGNEQCHHQAYLYDFSGQPWKTQMRVRQVMSAFYDDKADGQIGNNDCGQMSAWYVFSAVGFYPVNPANGVYVLGSPAVDHAQFNLANGKKFVVDAVGNSAKNIYIQSATLNGVKMNRDWITHKELLAGGTLRLVMGPNPNIKWGSKPADRPAATMPKGFDYAPLPEPATNKPVVLSLPIRVVCGEDDPVGNFVPDPNMLEGSTNRAQVRVDTTAPNSAPARVYASERYGDDFTYRFPVPKDRTYTVRLHFAEIFDGNAGMRVEKISINGKVVLPNFDIFAIAGMNKAVVREFKDVKPNADGTITIRIQAADGSPDQNAKISGIEIF